MPYSTRRPAHGTFPDDVLRFRQEMSDLSYAGIPSLRAQLSGFLEERHITADVSGRLLLSLSEILTNILRHSAQKPSVIRVTLELSLEETRLDVADDASPFATFDAKCNEAQKPMQAAENLCEGGYGLGCILQQHDRVSYVCAGDSADGLNHFTIMDGRAEKKVLFLVDDDPLALKTVHRLLAKAYDVVPFSRAADALEMFRQRRPDIIVSDLHMPDIDGLELRRRLSRLPGGDITPFIFLSGSRRHRDNPYISELGVDDFLSKPITETRLVNVVDRLLTRAQQVRHGLEGRFHAAVTDFLKPALPAACPGWTMQTFTMAAEAGGGDFTLHHEYHDHLLAALADVMGHGLEAKFFAYAYAGYLRSLFRFATGAQDAARFLQHLSKSVEHDAFLDKTIFTCQSFQLFADGRFAVASAGHPAPLLLGHDGRISVIEIAGPLPGLGGDSPYRLEECRLNRGDRILLATDGFFQAFDFKADGRAGLMAAIRELKDNSGPALWSVFQEKYRHKKLDDDATMIIAEYGGQP